MTDREEEQVRPGWLPPRPPDTPASPSRRPPPGPSGAAPRPRPPSFASRAAPEKEGRTDPLATASLFVALLALVLLTFTLGLGFLFALPCSALAWVLGTRAKGRIASDPQRGGSGIAHAGSVLGLVGMGIGAVAMVVWTILVLSGFSVDDLRRELEERRDAPSAPAQRAVTGDCPLGSQPPSRLALSGGSTTGERRAAIAARLGTTRPSDLEGAA